MKNLFRKQLLALVILSFSFSALSNCEIKLGWKTIPYRDTFYQETTISDFDILNELTPFSGPTITKFKDVIQNIISTDQMFLLNKQHKVFQKYLPEVAEKFLILINGVAGNILPARCLETILLDHHFSTQNSTKYYSEFGAFILTRDYETKIYFISNDLPMVSSSPEIKRKLDNDLSEGWTLSLHIHNHPFSLDNIELDIAGTVIPSGSSTKPGDIYAYYHMIKNYGLEAVMITNGFDSYHLSVDELHYFD
jgi:hypothetical protein